MELSFILAAVGITGQFVMTRNRRAGWWISLSATPLWVALTIVTGQYGLFLMNAGYAAAAIANLTKIYRERRPSGTAMPQQSNEPLTEKQSAEILALLTGEIRTACRQALDAGVTQAELDELIADRHRLLNAIADRR